MKDYKRSDYAANKKSKNIVYKSEVSKDSDITLEKFLASDSNLTVNDNTKKHFALKREVADYEAMRFTYTLDFFGRHIHARAKYRLSA